MGNKIKLLDRKIVKSGGSRGLNMSRFLHKSWEIVRVILLDSKDDRILIEIRRLVETDEELTRIEEQNQSNPQRFGQISRREYDSSQS